MSEIKAVLADIDGTLICHGSSRPSPEVQAAVEALQVPLIPVTGRSYSLMGKIFDSLQLEHPCILDGGATIAQPNGEHIWKQWLAREQVDTVVGGIGSFCMQLSCEPHHGRFNPAEVLDFKALGDAQSIFGVFTAEDETAVRERLQTVDDIGHRIMAYEDDLTRRCVQVTSAGVDKESGVRKLLEIIDLGDEPILVIGDDYYGDGPLFAAAGDHGVKVAMGNAQDELKAIATWVAPSATEHGFAAAMEQFGLLR